MADKKTLYDQLCWCITNIEEKEETTHLEEEVHEKLTNIQDNWELVIGFSEERR